MMLNNNFKMNFILILSINIIFSFAIAPDITKAKSLQYKLSLLGYNKNEINNIMSGKRTINQINNEKKIQMLGMFKKKKKSANKSNLYFRKISTQKKDNKDNIEFPEASKLICPKKFDQAQYSSKFQAPVFNFDSHYFDKTKKIKKPYIEKRVWSEPGNDIWVNNLLSCARPYISIIEEASYVNNVKKSLIMAIIKVESGFNKLAVSPKGAIGLMQLMPTTAKSLGISNPFNPSQNIHGGTKYFSHCLHELNDLELAIAAYNAGLTRVSKLTRIPPYKETKNFVKNVLHYEKLYDQLID